MNAPCNFRRVLEAVGALEIRVGLLNVGSAVHIVEEPGGVLGEVRVVHDAEWQAKLDEIAKAIVIAEFERLRG